MISYATHKDPEPIEMSIDTNILKPTRAGTYWYASNMLFTHRPWRLHKMWIKRVRAHGDQRLIGCFQPRNSGADLRIMKEHVYFKCI